MSADEENGRIESRDESDVPSFAPDDPLDGLEFGQWQSRYPKTARNEIRGEAIYLGVLLFIVPLGLVTLWLDHTRNLVNLSEDIYRPIRVFGVAWLGGLLGGSIFAIKWLYHSVARNIWHQDRRLWRILTPHISGGLAFAMIALVSSGMFRIFSSEIIQSLSLVVGMSFLVGYFSDSAVAKLTEIARTLFGSQRDIEKHTKKDSKGTKDKDDGIPNDTK